MDKLEHDMNIFTMLNSIAKIKAAIGAIIGLDGELLDKSKENYFMNALVMSNSEDERDIRKVRTPFRKFLRNDERKEWKKRLQWKELGLAALEKNSGATDEQSNKDIKESIPDNENSII